MNKLCLPLTSIVLLASACDSEAVDNETPRSAQQTDAELAEPAEHASMAVGMLCFKLGCSDQQRAELTAIAQSALPDADQRARRDLTIQTFADAFRADELDTEVVAALHTQRIADREHIRDSFLAAHQVLDAEQRDELADMMERGFGAPMMMKADRMANRLCKVAVCDEAQQADIATAIADGAAQPAAAEVRAMKRRVAEILRTDELDAKTLDRFADDMEAKHAQMSPRALETLAEVHAMLGAEQRDAVATKLEEEGPRGLMGPGASLR